jgi:serine kinase of HPr protein (carbohydrate metabolism regulator)
MDRAREKYIDLVSKGGYIGTLLNMPMVVADDVVICSLNEQELRESAPRLGVDLAELRRDHARAGAA